MEEEKFSIIFRDGKTEQRFFLRKEDYNKVYNIAFNGKIEDMNKGNFNLGSFK